MSTGTLGIESGPTPAVGSPDDAGSPLQDDAGGPGQTTIDDSVVEKIAARAVGEVDEVGGVASRVLGIQIGSDDLDRRPVVHARVDGSIVTLDVTLSVIYPAPVGQVTRHVREYVTDRIRELTGLSTRQVDISVTALHHPQAPRRRLA